MPFILIGAPVGALAFGLIPLAAVLPLFVACTSTLLLSMAFWRTPVVALMPDITPSRYRSQANGIINLMGGLGTIIASLVGSTLYEININFPFWMGSGLAVLAALLVFIFIKEPKQFEPVEEQPSMFKSLKGLIAEKDKSGLRILLAIFFWFLAYTGIEAFLTLYATKRLGIPEGDAGRLTGHMGIFFVLFAILAGIIGSRIGRRVTISIGLILMAALILGIAGLSPAFLSTTLTKLPVLGTIRVLNLFLMGSRYRLVLRQYQFPANGGGSDHGCPGGHLYRAVLSLLHPFRHRWTQPERPDRAVEREQLQCHDVRWPVLPADCPGPDAGRQAW